MLEGLAAWVLNTYLGQYLENLNTDQLSIGLLQGEVELENLPLRKDAFINLNLPIEIKSGYVGKIKLKIPFHRLRSEPWVISVEKLYIITGPIQPHEGNKINEEQQAHERKLALLDAFEAKWRAEHEAKKESTYYASSYSSWLSYGTTLVASIVENLQLNIKDVYIRYEDNLLNPMHVLSCGIIIKSLSAQSSNIDWIPSYVSSDSSDFTRKLVQLVDFAAYWDGHSNLIGNLSMSELDAYINHSSGSHHYLLEPVCAQARLQQNRSSSPLRSKLQPRFICDITLNKFHIKLNENQYHEFCSCIKELDRLESAKKFGKWRPTVEINGHSKDWWQYAIKCHVENIHKKYKGRNWRAALDKAKDIVLYVEIYKSHLINPVTLSSTFKAQKECLEQKLSFEDLKILREIAMQKLQKEEREKKQTEILSKNNGKGLLQRWFPLWSGWYSGNKTDEFESDVNALSEASELEEEILDVLRDTVENNTLMKRDVVFAKLNFELKRGSISLEKQMNETALTPHSQMSTAFELEFENVLLILESRPRLGSLLFNLKLGAMFLHDKMTPNTAFPLLITSHTKNNSSVIDKVTPKLGLNESCLFELIYERKPFNSTANYMLHIKSESMDIIYNSSVVGYIMEFFSSHQSRNNVSRYSEPRLEAMAKTQYEKLKQQTKIEFKKNWDHIMEGHDFYSEKWDIVLDISAPQILVPENISDCNTNLVIFDLGRFQFSTTGSYDSQKIEQELLVDSEDEDFRTPCSSPEELDVTYLSDIRSTLETIRENIDFESNEELLHERLYNKYVLELCNLQVLVVKAKDNWKFARLRGTSYMHILDRFNITIQFEKRILHTTDPQWPSATLSGSLPKLAAHVNELKIQSLYKCLMNLETFSFKSPTDKRQRFKPPSYADEKINLLSRNGESKSLIHEQYIPSDIKQEIQEETRLLIMQFSVDQMTLAVETRGRSIAELQVTGVKAMFTKRPYDTSLALTVHGLLLVDAMQTFGPDFELLLASHKQVSIDHVSGRICENETGVSSSPSSPTSIKPLSPSPLLQHIALSSIQFNHPSFMEGAVSPNSSVNNSKQSLPFYVYDSEALISIEMVFINSDCPSNEDKNENLRIISVQFNNLNIIANQETLLELINFTKLIYSCTEDQSTDKKMFPFSLDKEEQVAAESQNTTKTELSFDFHHLSLMLLRVVTKEGNPSARKVATATMHEARILATLGTTFKVQGSLGGLQLLNLTSEGEVHRRVLSIGHDPSNVKEDNLLHRLEAEVYHSHITTSEDYDTDMKAFIFSVEQPANKSPPFAEKEISSFLNVTLEVASVCYVHSMQFVNEIALYMTEFQIYMMNLLASIKSAATEVALDIVNRGTDALSTSLYIGMNDGAINQTYVGRIFEEKTFSAAQKSEKLFNDNIQVRLIVSLETPVIVLPRTPISAEVLVAQLGRISICNTHPTEDTEIPLQIAPVDKWNTLLERITIKIRNMNLYTVNVSNSFQQTSSLSTTKSSFPNSCIHDLYSHVSEACPIIHETAIEILIDRLGVSNAQPSPHILIMLGDDIFPENSEHLHQSNQALQVTCRIITPLTISLSRQQYCQILETLNSFMTIDKNEEGLSNANLFDVINKEENKLQSSVSTLKLENNLRHRSDSNSSDIIRKSFMPIHGYFEVPEFNVTLQSELSNQEQQGLVLLSFKDFSVNYIRNSFYITTIEISLQTISVEDLVQEPHSKHRHLMRSFTPPEKSSLKNFKSNFLSTSCPEMSGHEPMFFINQSLPDKLEPKNIFRAFHQHTEKYLYGRQTKQYQAGSRSNNSYPNTPPPSPSVEWSSTDCLHRDTLVHVKILLVDSQAPDFIEKYNSNNKLITVDFNCLETSINMHSWIMLLNFFNNCHPSEAHQYHPFPLSRQNSWPNVQDNYDKVQSVNEINTEIQIEVRSLSLVLHKENYELAKANVSAITACIANVGGNFEIQGKLGKISLHDLTPHGKVYSERFSSSGNEALIFHYFKFGTKDPFLDRDSDIHLKMRMSSVRYIHTQRFQTEIISFFQLFNELKSAHDNTSATIHKIKKKISERGIRIQLDINADSPVICIPEMSSSKNLLVIDLGKLTIRNAFHFAGSEGTISKRCQRSSVSEIGISEKKSYRNQEGLYMKKNLATQKELKQYNVYQPGDNEELDLDKHPCLLDVMHIDLEDMALYSAKKLDDMPKQLTPTDSVLDFGYFCIQIHEEPILKQKCKLHLQVERNLDSAMSHVVPDMSVCGLLSAVHCTLDIAQYKLIRGLLSFNIGEPLEDLHEIHSSATVMDDIVFQTGLTEAVWTCNSFLIDLENVSLEVLQNRSTLLSQREISLAKIDFIKSRFSYESYSDSFKDIDLVSQEILISDTRFKDSAVNTRPNVFTSILQPTYKSDHKSLQAEFHYRATRDFTRFTLLLNNMRLMTIFDWWESFLNFIWTRIESSNQTSNSNPMKIPKKMAYSVQHPSPLNVSAGILTKRAPIINKDEIPMEIKINITDTEIIVVEDASMWDTNAVILKCTAVIAYRPAMLEKPLSCSLQSLEVFSCILGVEDETALSIIDPVTVNVEINGKNKPSYIGGLLDATTTELHHILEISMHNLSIRLSYYDIQMFLQILNSIPRQTSGTAFHMSDSKTWPANFPVNKISKLEDLGFNRIDCIKAYEICKGNLDEAALWLTLNATVKNITNIHNDQLNKDDESSKINIDLGGIEIRISCFSFCLIDDCKDADVPLIELSLTAFYVEQLLEFEKKGKAHFQISSDYYNRSLSGWEPLMEPWKCNANWTVTNTSDGNRQSIQLNAKADDIVNINITSELIDVSKNVMKNWAEDYNWLNPRSRSYYQVEDGLAAVASSSNYRRRSPFVPFALKNDTGSNLWFTTLTTTPNKLAILEFESSAMKEENFNWTAVRPGEIVPFTFEGRGKLRHRDTHDLKIHQLFVRVDGWQPVAPVSVDKVGIYFRHAKPQVNRTASIYTEIPPARIVFAVTLKGSAQKLITVRSALLLRNCLEEMVEVKLENTATQSGASRIMTVPSNVTVPIPLTSVFSKIWVRPVERWSVSYCTEAVNWQNVKDTNKITTSVMCPAAGGRELFSSYRFCVCIKRLNFPSDRLIASTLSARSRQLSGTISQQIYIQPGHVITLLPPVVMTNLLPYDLRYEIVGTPHTGCIRPGKKATLHMINIHEAIRLILSFENFLECDPLIIQPGLTNYVIPLQAYDAEKRLLMLRVKILGRMGVARKILVSSPYWLINKSGLPVIFRQDGANQDAAGQFHEHELARSVTPLLFSFADREAPQMSVMRVGKSVHSNGHPHWCTRFHLEKGVRVRQLKVSSSESRPDWVYNIGIDVRAGRGRYRDTYIVILSPRFQLDNRTTHKLEFAQKFQTNHTKYRCHLSSTPKCTLPFHWPRLDLDQLLCVRQKDIANCHWSGGFSIDKIDSFHINMRDECGKMHFLRVEIILQGATYFVVFMDADKMPPPFRIDNFSQVPITYYQLNVSDEHLKTVVRPNSSVPYAWDEPILSTSIVCCAPGGTSAAYNMNVFGEGKQLTYENFIYIAFTATFQSECAIVDPNDLRYQELVLDVPQGSRVILSQKEPGKRTQLWRMTSTGMLQHEGSSPPRDPRKPFSSVNPNRYLVLDIAGLASQPQQYIPLMLRKPDERRKSTQTWRFTDDGRLCCDLKNMYVQADGGYHGLVAGNDVVLGPVQLITYAHTDAGVPSEQVISRQRLWPGSGMLTVKILPDGPTRVLQIIDIRQKVLLAKSGLHSDWVVVTEAKLSKITSEEGKTEVTNKFSDIHIGVKLVNGLGISIINKTPEELLYISLSNIVFEYNKTAVSSEFDGSVENFQIDNQLHDAEIPVFLHVTPTGKHDNHRHLPAIHFTAHKLPSNNLNAHIFKHLMINVKNLTIQLEERLLWKFLQFIGYNQSEGELEKLDENEFDSQKTLIAATSANAKHFYFSTLKLLLNQVRLSMYTTNRLPTDLQLIKDKTGLTLIKFEDVQIDLDPFIRVHPFETSQLLLDSIVEHYKEDLKSQAHKILAAFDFLGNPLGLVNDVSEGLSTFISEGDVGSLLKNVTHGISNSAAKVAGSLSDGLGRVTMDRKHEEARKKLWLDHRGSSSEHLVAGVIGLGYGIVGGMTSILSQTYKGAASEGVPGFFSGLGKGLVGTVAKPAVGVLDFAAGAASAVRDTSKSSIHSIPPPVRLTRLCIGPGGLLCRYSEIQSHGQRQLYKLNKQDYNELFIAYEQLQFIQEGLRALITSKRVIFLTKDDTSPSNVVYDVDLSELYHCKPIKTTEKGITQYSLELTVKASNRSRNPLTLEYSQKRPKVLCDSEVIAQRVAQHINYAKSLYEERKHTLLNLSDSDNED